jgi:hypothetical protein
MTHEEYIEGSTLRIGDILPNGWVVIDARGDQDHAVVLAGNQDNAHPYATWFARLGDEGWDTFWGTYHLDVHDAMDAFAHRIAS